MPIPENSEEPLMGFKEGAQRSHNTFTFQKGNSGFLVGRSWRGTKRDAVLGMGRGWLEMPAEPDLTGLFCAMVRSLGLTLRLPTGGF